jgi:hypothetical protein
VHLNSPCPLSANSGDAGAVLLNNERAFFAKKIRSTFKHLQASVPFPGLLLPIALVAAMQPWHFYLWNVAG